MPGRDAYLDGLLGEIVAAEHKGRAGPAAFLDTRTFNAMRWTQRLEHFL